MIQLSLGSEPSVLKSERRARLPNAVSAFNIHGPGSQAFTSLLDKGYDVAKSELRRRQHGKCAYCEKQEDAFRRPVEHFRPKKKAEDFVGGKWVSVNTHYWWLTWTWRNLYFACDECNRTGRKGSRFPIAPGSSRIPAPTAPAPTPIPRKYFALSTEQPLLVDPRNDDPFKHLQWIPSNSKKAKRNWTWVIDGRDIRGDTTISVLGLHSREDEVNSHLNPLKLLWQQIENHVVAGRIPDAQTCWDSTVATFIDDPEQPFRNAAWWAINSLCDYHQQKAHGFRHPPVPVV